MARGYRGVPSARESPRGAPTLARWPAARRWTSEIEALFGRPADEGVSLALVVQQHGEIVAERYGTQPANLFEAEPAPVTAATPLISWSMAKSITHAAVGSSSTTASSTCSTRRPSPEWQGTDKEAITVLDLLEMRSGLALRRGLRRRRASDVHRHAVRRRGQGPRRLRRRQAARPPAGHVSGATRRARRTSSAGSSATSSPAAPDATPADREAAMRAFLDQRLFGPPGMTDAEPRFDEAGNWVGSSYVHAPARQFARFGELYLHDGCVGRRAGAADGHGRPRPHGRRPRPRDRLRLRPPLVDVARPARARSPPTATRASTSSCSRSTTPWSCTSARPTPPSATALVARACVSLMLSNDVRDARSAVALAR